MYYFIISESNFSLFKRQHDILVEFHKFPTKFIELLNYIIEGEVNHPSQELVNGLASLFHCKLELGTGRFTIIESNQFNRIKHLEVTFMCGDDEAIKLYLSSRLYYALGTIDTTTKRIKDLETALYEERQKNEHLEKEMFELR